MVQIDEIMEKLKIPLPWLKGNGVVEKKFTTIWLKKIKDLELAYMFKISDADPRVKPYDVFGVMDWVMLAIEVKRITWTTCHPFQLLRWSSIKNQWGQVEWLRKTHTHWWVSLVVVYSDKVKDYAIFDFTKLDFNTKYKFNV